MTSLSRWRLSSPRSSHTGRESKNSTEALQTTESGQNLDLERSTSHENTTSPMEGDLAWSIDDSPCHAYSFSSTASTTPELSYNCSIDLFSTDSICSKYTFDTMIHDWLELVYPLVPIVHRPTFRQQLEAHRETSDPIFFSLLSCICASLIATIPSSFKKYRELDESFRFRTRLEMVDFCHELAVKSRGPDYFDESTQEKWSIAYLLAAAYGNLRYFNRCLMFATEGRHHMRRLGCQVASSYSGLSKVEEQLRKRSLWLSLCGYL